MPVITGNGIDVHFEVDGEGSRTVVLINGIGDSLEAWSMQLADRLSAGYRIVRANRGIGRSSQPTGPATANPRATGTSSISSR